MPSSPETRRPVRTERLALRPATVADLPSVFAYRRLAVVSEWLPTHPSDVHAFVERLRQPERLAATYVLERGGALIGDLHRSGRWLDGVGYGILAEEWRRRADA
jgi:RimJ/RimL family protein N-acetyltransferase